MKILVTGSTGQVGSAIAAVLRQNGIPILTPSRLELDLSSGQSIRDYVNNYQPRWIINAAAYTAVDQAEVNRLEAHVINTSAPKLLGEAAAAIRATVIHFSTDYVFSGEGTRPWKELDLTGPVNIYGESKLAGELGLAESGASFVILRTSWVYSVRSGNFFTTILRLAREKQTLSIVADQYGAPTWSRDLALLTHSLIEQMPDHWHPGDTKDSRLDKVYHACGNGTTSWFGFAQEILNLASTREPSIKWARIIPVDTSAYPTIARRPSNSRMDCSLLEEKLGFIMPSWKDTLKIVVQQYFDQITTERQY